MSRNIYISLFALYVIQICYFIKICCINPQTSKEINNIVELQQRLFIKKEEILKRCLTCENHELANFIEKIHEKVVCSTDEETFNRICKIYDHLKIILIFNDNMIDFIIESCDVTSILNEELAEINTKFSDIDDFKRIEITLDVFRNQLEMRCEEYRRISGPFQAKKKNLLDEFNTISPHYIQSLKKKEELCGLFLSNPKDFKIREQMVKLYGNLQNTQEKIEFYNAKLFETLKEFVLKLAINDKETQKSFKQSNCSFAQRYKKITKTNSKSFMIEMHLRSYLNTRIQNSMIFSFGTIAFNESIFLEILKEYETSEDEKNFIFFKDEVEKILTAMFERVDEERNKEESQNRV